MSEKYTVNCAGICYGQIEEGFFSTNRGQGAPIKDGKTKLNTGILHIDKETKKPHIENRSLTFTLDLDNLTLTREDGTIFNLKKIDAD